MTDIAITVQDVSKCYQVYANQSARLRNALQPSYQEGVTQVWALKDINFDVRRGESFAVIGRNGSGKSTLLEIITQTLTPTTGTVQVNGRVAALLELGSGFNPEYTGRENVFLNGLLLGLTRTQVENRFDTIAAFADIGDVLDRQVKTYSSGMLVRLAFAVQVALEPDILIVDEALSVGDYFFQQKCFGRLRQMREEGLTLLFVSHDMGTVRDLCKQTIYLRQGVSLFIGDTRTAVQCYLNEGVGAALPVEEPAVPIMHSIGINKLQTVLEGVSKDAAWVHNRTDSGRLLFVRIVNEQGCDTDHAPIGAIVRVQVHYRSLVDDAKTTVSLSIRNRFDQVIFLTTAKRLGVIECETHAALYAIFTFEITLALEAGQYSLHLGINQPTGNNKGVELDSTGWFGPFRVDWDYENEMAPFLGMFGLPVSGQLSLQSS